MLKKLEASDVGRGAEGHVPAPPKGVKIFFTKKFEKVKLKRKFFIFRGYCPPPLKRVFERTLKRNQWRGNSLLLANQKTHKMKILKPGFCHPPPKKISDNAGVARNFSE